MPSLISFSVDLIIISGFALISREGENVSKHESAKICVTQKQMMTGNIHRSHDQRRESSRACRLGSGERGRMH